MSRSFLDVHIKYPIDNLLKELKMDNEPDMTEAAWEAILDYIEKYKSQIEGEIMLEAEGVMGDWLCDAPLELARAHE